MQPGPALDPTRPHLNVAVLGHTGHGKTRLAAALTARSFVAAERPWSKFTRRIQCVDELPIMGRDGEPALSRRSTAVEFESPYRHYSSLDAPGARRLVRAALAACGAADAVILVVSAVKGAMPRTREHALFARALGVQHIVVFLSHCDQMNDPDLLDLAENECREVLTEVGFDGDSVPFVRGAVTERFEHEPRWAATVDDLLAVLDRDVPDPARDVDGRAVATVLFRYDTAVVRPDRIALVHVSRGTIRIGDKLNLFVRGGTMVPTIVAGMRVFDRPCEVAAAGEIVTLRLSAREPSAIDRRWLRRGATLLAPASADPWTSAYATVRWLSRDEGGRHTNSTSGQQGWFGFGASGSRGRMFLPIGTVAAKPGETISRVIVEMDRPILQALPAKAVFRDGSDGLQRKLGGPPRWSGTSALVTFDERRAPNAPKP